MMPRLMLSIRAYRPADLPQLAALFYDTVHAVCSAHYTPEECDAWAPTERDLAPWAESLAAHLSLVAELHGSIVGFGDADLPASYLDRLYVHKDFLRRGIATALCEALESAARAAGVSTLTSHASITGEHGIGLAKAPWFPSAIGPVAMDLHRALKSALDPTGTLNPGKMNL